MSDYIVSTVKVCLALMTCISLYGSANQDTEYEYQKYKLEYSENIDTEMIEKINSYNIKQEKDYKYQHNEQSAQCIRNNIKVYDKQEKF